MCSKRTVESGGRTLNDVYLSGEDENLTAYYHGERKFFRVRIVWTNDFAQKVGKSVCGAPKAGNMKARGKRRAERGASPLDPCVNDHEALKERNNRDDISHCQCSLQSIPSNQGRRASRLPLATIVRAVGAASNRMPTLAAINMLLLRSKNVDFSRATN
jgi:hypothetical protein